MAHSISGCISGTHFSWRAGRRLVAVLTAGGLSAVGLLAPLAHAETGEQSMSSVAPMSSTFFYEFPGLPRVWVSRHGNVTRFEGPSGYDHVGVGTVVEGYVVCYGGRTAYDLGFTETGFQEASASCSANTCTMTRTTSDGRLRLRQVLTKTGPERSLDIQMSLTNLGPSLSGVILRRQVDLDVDTGGALGSGNFENWFGSSETASVFAWNAATNTVNEGHAVMLRHLQKSTAVSTYAAKVTSSISDLSCNPSNLAHSGPVRGDHGASLQYNVGTLGQGATFTAKIQYERN